MVRRLQEVINHFAFKYQTPIQSTTQDLWTLYHRPLTIRYKPSSLKPWNIHHTEQINKNKVIFSIKNHFQVPNINIAKNTGNETHISVYILLFYFTKWHSSICFIWNNILFLTRLQQQIILFSPLIWIPIETPSYLMGYFTFCDFN